MLSSGTYRMTNPIKLSNITLVYVGHRIGNRPGGRGVRKQSLVPVPRGQIRQDGAQLPDEALM